MNSTLIQLRRNRKCLKLYCRYFSVHGSVRSDTPLRSATTSDDGDSERDATQASVERRSHKKSAPVPYSSILSGLLDREVRAVPLDDGDPRTASAAASFGEFGSGGFVRNLFPNVTVNGAKTETRVLSVDSASTRSRSAAANEASATTLLAPETLDAPTDESIEEAGERRAQRWAARGGLLGSDASSVPAAHTNRVPGSFSAYKFIIEDLPRECNAESVSAAVLAIGGKVTVEHVQFYGDRWRGRRRLNCFVHVASRAESAKLLKVTSKFGIYVLGQRCSVVSPKKKFALFVGKLPFEVSDTQAMLAHFRQTFGDSFPREVRIDLSLDAHGKSQGHAIMRFSSHAAALHAYSLLREHWWHERRLLVHWANTNQLAMGSGSAPSRKWLQHTHSLQAENYKMRLEIEALRLRLAETQRRMDADAAVADSVVQAYVGDGSSVEHGRDERGEAVENAERRIFLEEVGGDAEVADEEDDRRESVSNMHEIFR